VPARQESVGGGYMNGDDLGVEYGEFHMLGDNEDERLSLLN
jgi:hypothetical protein